MKRAIIHVFTLLMVLAGVLGGIEWAESGDITAIPLSDFDNPKVLDFEAAADGPISSTDGLFNDFGIRRVSIAVSSDPDFYDFGVSGRALFAPSFGDFVLDSPGGSQPQGIGKTWVLDFSANHKRFGVSFADLIGTDVTIEFSPSVDGAGATTFFHPSGSTEIFYFESTEFFNTVTISISADDGFGLDNLTLDNPLIPDPSGLFNTPQEYPAGLSPASLTTLNLNNDIPPDLAVSNRSEGKITVLINNGDGTFARQSISCTEGVQPARACTTGDGPIAITSGPFGDNGLLIATADRNDDNVTVLVKDRSESSFSKHDANVAVLVGAIDEAGQDLDGCGTSCVNPEAIAMAGGDLVVAVERLNPDGSRLLILESEEADGEFSLKQEIFLNRDTETPTAVTAADLDGNGDLDFAVTLDTLPGELLVLGTETPVGVDVGRLPREVIAAKLNADEHIDLAVANEGDNTILILLNDGNGNFTTLPPVEVGGNPRSVTAADLDGDGDLDLAVANATEDTISVLENNGEGTFTERGRERVGGSPSSVKAAKLDRNCAPDLVVANTDGDNVSVLLNLTPNAAFAAFPACITGVSTGRPYELDRVEPGIGLYIDRLNTTHKLVAPLPAEIANGTLIRTANDDKFVTADEHVQLFLHHNAIVYVAYDPRATSQPNWLQTAWSLTDITVPIDDPALESLDLYARAASAGDTIILGGNRAPSAVLPVSGSHYIVIVQLSPQITVTPMAHDFGNVPVGILASASFTISNTGAGPLVLAALALHGPEAAAFSLSSDACSNQTVPPEETCRVSVRFAPTSTGVQNATLTLPSTTPATPVQEVVLHGTGVASNIAVMPASHSFGDIRVETQSSHIFAVSNTGAANLALGTIMLTGSDTTQFRLQNDSCSAQTLAPSNSCTLEVVFAPTTTGAKSAMLSIPSNAPTTPVTVFLNGAGGVVAVSISPTAHDFGAIAVEQPTTAQPFTLSNTGTVPLILGTVALTGPDASQFALQNDPCSGQTLLPSGSCTVAVNFIPTLPGPQVGTLSIASDDPHFSGIEVSLNGTGLCPANGDVNEDGDLTPVDAHLVVLHFLGLAEPPLNTCQQDRANIFNPTGSGITPADALCIFQILLELLSCLN